MTNKTGREAIHKRIVRVSEPSEYRQDVYAVEHYFLGTLSLLDWPAALYAAYKRLWLLASVLAILGLLTGALGSKFHPDISTQELSKGSRKIESPLSQSEAFFLAAKGMFQISLGALICIWHYKNWSAGLVAFPLSMIALLVVLFAMLMVNRKLVKRN